MDSMRNIRTPTVDRDSLVVSLSAGVERCRTVSIIWSYCTYLLRLIVWRYSCEYYSDVFMACSNLLQRPIINLETVVDV
jgi:hypothetical protein